MNCPDIKTIKNAFTHNGVFHADDVFSSALLLMLNPEIKIERGEKVPQFYEGIVFDIGLGRFDHHQSDRRVRENGIPYAAFGLLWEEYGTLLLGDEDARQFDEDFIQALDESDNTGRENALAQCISDWNPQWNELQPDERAGFSHIVAEKSYAVERSRERDGVLYVCFPSSRGGYMIQAVPQDNGEMELKKPFPIEWRGKTAEELRRLTGIETFCFCHNSGFLCVADTEEDAGKVAQMALKY